MYKGRLSDLSSYVSEKIPVAALTDQTYIGVDNMLSNRGGVKPSEYVPEAGLVTKFEQGDILLGNIRPYFKKIWLTEFDGGCSPDVLVIRPKHGVSSKFLYAYLSTDGFFDYDMKGAKGSKMPRGDKDHIMRYEITIPDAQEKIGSFIININEKITNNDAICADLEGMAKLLYDYWFVQFDFPDENGKPYKSSGGKMVWNEELKREIPEGWEVVSLGTQFSITMGTSPEGKSINENEEGVPFYQGKTDFGFRFPAVRTYTTTPIRYAYRGDTLLSVRAPVGALNRAIETCCIGRGVASIHADEFPSYAYYTSLSLRPRFEKYNGDGTTFGCIGRDDLFAIPSVKPERSLIEKFEKITRQIDAKIENAEMENAELASLRDFLLPMLMNGQVKVKGA